jgi:asparagine synthetase B (glutamine-hydrolysing)
MNKLTTILKERLQDEIGTPSKRVALLSGGGIDANALLFALLEMGIEVHMYSFFLEGTLSTDFKCAKEVANQYFVPFTPISIPKDIETLKRDVKDLIKNYGCVKKTDVECSRPMKYAIERVEEEIIVTGLGADGHFVISKKGMIHYRDTVEGMDEFRKNLFENPNYAQQKILNKIARENGKRMVNPFLTKEVIEHFKGTSWQEINTPKEKQEILNAFPDHFLKVKVRRHSNFQLGDTCFKDCYEQLLDTELNPDGKYKSVVGVYNHIRKSQGEQLCLPIH